jgi:hypothetical protein
MKSWQQIGSIGCAVLYVALVCVWFLDLQGVLCCLSVIVCCFFSLLGCLCFQRFLEISMPFVFVGFCRGLRFCGFPNLFGFHVVWSFLASTTEPGLIWVYHIHRCFYCVTFAPPHVIFLAIHWCPWVGCFSLGFIVLLACFGSTVFSAFFGCFKCPLALQVFLGLHWSLHDPFFQLFLVFKVPKFPVQPYFMGFLAQLVSNVSTFSPCFLGYLHTGQVARRKI